MNPSKVLLLAIGLSALAASPGLANPVGRGDSVQVVLRQLSRDYPNLVGYSPEVKRHYILDPTRESIPERYILAIQDAFYYDARNLCMYYGRMYLADWQTLLSKAARESFWGTSYLAIRASNYFGLRRTNKEWVCNSFSHCRVFVKDDPITGDYIQFPGFEASLWMFIHTIYSPHYLERMPDGGARVALAIEFERQHRAHYWQPPKGIYFYAQQLPGDTYTPEEMVYTWSEHPINNFCEACDRQTDLAWVEKVRMAEMRAEVRNLGRR